MRAREPIVPVTVKWYITVAIAQWTNDKIKYPFAGRIPHDNPPRWLYMLTAYVDESGQEQKQDYMFVAGFYGNDEQWGSVPPAWKTAIAPRRSLHMVNCRFKRDSEKRMLERAGVIPNKCGLTPVVGGVRQSDYEDLISGTREEKLLNGYFFCSFVMAVNALRGIPAYERLEIVFEHNERYWWMIEIAMRVLSGFTHYPDILLPDGTPKLAKWRSVPKGSTSLTEPADYFAYALRKVWTDSKSVKAKWCQPMLGSNGGNAFGYILTKDKVRQMICDGNVVFMIQEAQRRLRDMYANKRIRRV